MDTSIPLQERMVRVGPLVNTDRLLRSLGHDPLPVFAACELDPSIYDDPDNQMPYLRSSQLMERCVEVADCDHFGLLLGQLAEPSHLGLPGFLVHAAPTVQQALTSLVENLDLHDDGGTASLEIKPEFCSLSYSLHLDGVAVVAQISDLAAAMLCKIMSFLCGPDWVPLTVSLERREPTERALYRRFFRAPLYFDATETVVTFSNRCLAKKPPTADALLFRHLEQEARQIHDLHQGDLMEALPAVLRRNLLAGKFSAQEIAESFGLHERTLHRRLRESGTNFRKELDAVRRTLSQQLLSHTGQSISEIAVTLGYADASGFIRAFERWCGISPNAWRRKNTEP